MKKPVLLTFLLSLFLALVLFNTGCKKTAVAPSAIPVVTTTDVILDVTTTTAQSGGTLTSSGTDPITSQGVCYSSTNKTPTIADLKTSETISFTVYSFTSNLTALTPNTTYYLRAYATSALGTGYGSIVTFTTSGSLSAVTGIVTTLAGNATAGNVNANGAGAEFNNPQGIAVDAQGNVYVADGFNNAIRKITTTGDVSTFAGNGQAGQVDGPAASAEFYSPQSLAVDAQGNVYVADYGNSVIRKITAGGVVSTFAGNGTSGYIDGAATAAEFNGPSGMAFDKAGNLYVADRKNNIIRKITTAGVVSSVAGTKTAGYINATVNTSTGVNASFNNPNSIAVDAAGNIYVADLGNSAIREITPAGVVTTIAGGTVQSAVLGYPAGISIDASGNLYITDESGRILELTSARVLYVLAGATGVTGYADGNGISAQFNAPQGIAIDAINNIYVADLNNNRIRKITIKTTN